MKRTPDEDVEQEIERLKQSPMVQLAQLEQRLKYKRRQWMYQLRYYEKRGQELTEAGWTRENLIDKYSAEVDDAETEE